MVATPWGESDSLRDRRLRPGPGASAEAVAENQRDRLFGAMVVCVSERGYEATRVADLVEVSGVSSRSFYDLFPGKEACFVAAFEAIVQRVLGSLSSENPRPAGEERLLAAYDSFARLLADQPATAAMCLIEAYAAGPAALEALEAAVAGIEAVTTEGLSPEQATMPEDMIRAHVGAIQEIARTRLREGVPEEMRTLAPELAKAMASYRPPASPLRLATRPPSFGAESVAAHDDAERALRAFAVVVAERGYAGVTIHEVAKRGSMSPSTFYASFRDKEDALLAAIDSIGAHWSRPR